MTRPPRPRAFRLDDRRIALDDRPAPYAPEAVIQSQHEPIPPAVQPAPIDDAELKVEAAQKSGLIARSRLTLAGLAWTGLGGLVSLALGLWATNLIEGLFAKAELLGIIAAPRSASCSWSASWASRCARSSRSRGRRGSRRSMSLWRGARGRRPRRGATPGRPACRALSQPAGHGARAGRSRGRGARDHRRARPHRRRRARAAASARP